MNEINLKFCLNALIQLLDEWGGNFFSWEKIFNDEEDDNIEIDFGKYIKNEDVLENFEKMIKFFGSSEFQTLMSLEIENDISIINSIQAESDDGIELLSNPVFQKFSKSGIESFEIEDCTSLLQLLENPTYEKIIEKLCVVKIEKLKSALQCLKNFYLDLDLERMSELNISTTLGASHIITNNSDAIKGLKEMNSPIIDADVLNTVKQVEKKYVFNTIFEIIATEGREKIFKYTFSEAVKIMRSSEIILIKKQIN
jgi:hypothetical protein